MMYTNGDLFILKFIINVFGSCRLQWLCARALHLEIEWSLCTEEKGFDFRHGQRGRESIIIDESNDDEKSIDTREKEALRQSEEDFEQLFTLMGKNILGRLSKFMVQPTGEDLSEALQVYYVSMMRTLIQRYLFYIYFERTCFVFLNQMKSITQYHSFLLFSYLFAWFKTWL